MVVVVVGTVVVVLVVVVLVVVVALVVVVVVVALVVVVVTPVRVVVNGDVVVVVVIIDPIGAPDPAVVPWVDVVDVDDPARVGSVAAASSPVPSPAGPDPVTSPVMMVVTVALDFSSGIASIAQSTPRAMSKPIATQTTMTSRPESDLPNHSRSVGFFRRRGRLGLVGLPDSGRVAASCSAMRRAKSRGSRGRPEGSRGWVNGQRPFQTGPR
jgi:hypothetical protein